MDSEGEDELGRPRYRAAPGPAGAAPGPDGRGGPGRRAPNTAQEAYDAITFAAFAWLIPLFGGVMAIRRGSRALRVIADSDGALGGIGAAVWARRLGWVYIVGWGAVLYQYALVAMVFVFDIVRHAI